LLYVIAILIVEIFRLILAGDNSQTRQQVALNWSKVINFYHICCFTPHLLVLHQGNAMERIVWIWKHHFVQK